LASPPTLDQLDDAVLALTYDPGSIERGRAYAEEGRVTVLTAEPGAVKAVCLGSGRATYLVRVWWERRNGDIDLADACSCPLGGACKHCVATILTARRQGAARPPADEGPPSRADWRRLLADLDTSDDGGGEAAPVGLALQVTVTHPTPSRYVQTGPRLTIRPMRQGKGGKWIKTGATWRDIASGYGYSLDPVDPTHRAALKSLMTSGPTDLAYANNQTVPLDRFGPDVWHHLQRAVEVGVALIGEHPSDTVDLCPSQASPRVDLSADDEGNVVLSASLSLDGQVVTLEENRSALIGTPPHGLWVRDGGRLELIALADALHPTVARLATTPAVSVPAHDVEELLDVYQPALARHARVESSDGTVSIATSRFEGLTLVVERPALDRATLHWAARYRRGDRVSHHSLLGPGGRGRDRAAETDALDALDLPAHLLPQLLGVDGRPRDMVVSGPAVLTLFAEVLPWLQEKGGVDVDLVGTHPPLQEATEDPLISLVVHDDDDERHEGNDWFDLGVEVTVDGQSIDFVTLFAALARGDEALILPSGTWLRLDRPELERLRELIEEARALADPSATGVARLNRFQAGWWEELAALGVVTAQSQRWADNVARMAALAAPEPVEPPPDLDARLRHYQQEGFEWLVFLHRHGLGGILADDMGLGKTIQTLALCLHVRRQRPDARFLVVAPTSVVENWAREAAHFAPGLPVRTIGETAARRGRSLGEEVDGAALVVTSYALFRLEFEQYADLEWEILLLDEAQFVKNHQGKTYQCARRLEATTKVAITGTPLENSLMDLWSLLSITAPGLFPDPKRFSDTYRKPIESGEAPERLATLRRRIAPLLRRRTKDAVLTELPPKTEQTVEIELGSRHARIYQTQLQRQRQKVLGLVGDVQKHRFEILKSLTILRQLALDPALVDDEHEGIGSAKLDRLLDDLTQVVAEGHRALVFSQFTRYMARLRPRLDAAGIAHSYLDGRTRDRSEAIARFKDGDAPVFVISLKAGGFGLNLTEADYVFVLDPWWNPATENQAVDRTHRIGQENPVVVYRYVSTGTIEEKVMELKARKADLFASVVDGDGALAGALTEDDIRGLLDLG
jgi:superfamily II DNA or RNA helicase